MAPPEKPPRKLPTPQATLGFGLPLAEAERIRDAAERQQLTLSQFLRKAAQRACDTPEE